MPFSSSVSSGNGIRKSESVSGAAPAPASAPAARPSWEIDLTQLVLREKIGGGSYGSVYRGTYQGHEVAVKVLDFGEAETMARAQFVELRNSFKQEVAVWSTLSHPNITKFIGASVSSADGFMLPSFLPEGSKNPMSALRVPSLTKGSRPFRIGGHVCCVVAEFVSGGTLKDFLIKHRRSKLPLKTVVHLALDLAQGLEYLHEKKVVHRDIKSENLLMTKQGHVKLADFGVARVEAANPRDMTGSTGTLGYMAPEVLDGRPYNHKADVYSFGVCLWEIYCCDMPFPSLSLKDMAAVVNNGLRPQIPGICPKDLADLMTRCWDARPNKRPEMKEAVSILGAVDVHKGQGMASIEEVPSGCLCLF